MADCNANLANIAKECGGGNSAGLKTTLYICHKEEVASIGSATAHAVSTMTMRSADAGPPEIEAGVFKTWSISRGQQTYLAETIGEDENRSYNVTLTCFISKKSAAKSNILNGMIGGEYIVIAEDRNGVKEIIGDTSEGCIVTVGSQVSDANGYPVTINWLTSHLPYVYTGTITTA